VLAKCINSQQVANLFLQKINSTHNFFKKLIKEEVLAAKVLRTFSPQGQQDSQTALGAPSGNRTRDRSTQFLTDSALARKAA